MSVLLVAGIALLPGMELSDKPNVRHQNRLDITFNWNGVSPQVAEQEVTSRIEGLMASVKGVESVSSESHLGGGRVRLVLKKDVNVPMLRFEVASLLRQLNGKLPEGVSYPRLSGGEISDRSNARQESVRLLSYRINADMDGNRIREYMEHQVRPLLEHLNDVTAFRVTGGTSQYLEITYDPLLLVNYGLSASDIAKGLCNFIGQKQLVGDVDEPSSDGTMERITLLLETIPFAGDIGEVPLKTINGKTIYLNSLASWSYRDELPSHYYRVNGLNTVYMYVEVAADANLIHLSKEIRSTIDKLKPCLRDGVSLTLISDASEDLNNELHRLELRTGLSLLILLAFVWLVSRSWKYLLIIFVTLLTNLMAAVIVCRLFGISLHIYSLAGVTVSFGMIVDATIVMVDHYGYYRDRTAFMPILAALLTTMGSLIVVFFMPDFIRSDLYDFSRIVIVNLSLALLIALLFVPALCEQLRYDDRKSLLRLHRAQTTLAWSHFYRKYVVFTQKRKWIYLIALALSFGGATCLFAKFLKADVGKSEVRIPMLCIRGKMPLGGNIHQLNEKVLQVEQLISGMEGIKRYETTISGDARIMVEFEDDVVNGSLPYYVESCVIGKLLDIGGAEWSTSGVSQRGFSNSTALTDRSECIVLKGYNYGELYRYAQRLAFRMEDNRRVRDLMIENSCSGIPVDEISFQSDAERLALSGLELASVYQAMREILSEAEIGQWSRLQGGASSDAVDIRLVSAQKERYDLWHLQNGLLHIDDGSQRGRDVSISDLGKLIMKETKNTICRECQEYVLYVSYNYLGSYESKNRFAQSLVKEFKDSLPVGYSCSVQKSFRNEDEGSQYWILLFIVVIVFFICAILFESLVQPFAIILLVPVSFIGVFLSFYITKVPFGTGGFASLVLLCGLVVNSGIYIVCEYNNLCARNASHGLSRSLTNLYLNAYNRKIVPVLLTVLSTVLGLLPFFFEGVKDSFWFSFAVGTIGGLFFSLFALVFILPIFLPLDGLTEPNPEICQSMK